MSDDKSEVWSYSINSTDTEDITVAQINGFSA